MFHPGRTCFEREQLLGLLNEALATNVNATGNLASVAGTKERDLFCAVLEEVGITFMTAKTAWESYFEHVAKHGC
jgi:hypothetical protein